MNVSDINKESYWVRFFSRLFCLHGADERYLIFVSEVTLWCGLGSSFPTFIPDNDP